MIILDNLEILDTVEFLVFFITGGHREFISAECQIFYPVAFFLGAFKGYRGYDVRICTPGEGREKFFFQMWTHYIPLERKFYAD